MKKFLQKAVSKVAAFLVGREKLLSLISKNEEKVLLEFKRSGYLYDIGWTKSIITREIIDVDGNPLPWVTYPFIQFIEPRLNNSLSVFEYGSGNSTHYYSKRVASVSCVEHDKLWYDQIKAAMPANVNLFYSELADGGEYCHYAARTNQLYEMIIVDGRDRVNSCIHCLPALTSSGVIILDDSEREKYAGAHAFLTAQGFKKINFWGTAPAIDYLKCTTIFYRAGNILDI
jgi:hypothetical protein